MVTDKGEEREEWVGGARKIEWMGRGGWREGEGVSGEWGLLREGWLGSQVDERAVGEGMMRGVVGCVP